MLIIRSTNNAPVVKPKIISSTTYDESRYIFFLEMSSNALTLTTNTKLFLGPRANASQQSRKPTKICD